MNEHEHPAENGLHHTSCPAIRGDAFGCLCPELRPLKSDACGCPIIENGDVRCHICREYVNKRCWNCRTPRGEGPCPNPTRVTSPARGVA